MTLPEVLSRVNNVLQLIDLTDERAEPCIEAKSIILPENQMAKASKSILTDRFMKVTSVRANVMVSVEA